MDVTRPDLFIYETGYFVGVDLGQTFDPTAIAVVERQKAIQQRDVIAKPPATEYNLRHLERLPLGTNYPAQVAYVQELLRRAPLSTHTTSTYIDQTGVGRAVFDMFRQSDMRRMYGVTIVAGDNVTTTADGYHVAKKDLVSRLQAVFHAKQLAVDPELADATALMRELQDFRVKFSTAGNPIFGAREGAHDDIVLATALAIFGATQPQPVGFSPRDLDALDRIGRYIPRR